MIITYVGQRKESFIGELVKEKKQVCGVSILTKTHLTNEVFNCFGIHSLFDAPRIISSSR